MESSLLKEVLRSCIPAILSLMMIGLYGVIDGLFVGNATSDVGLAAINIAWPLIACVNAIGVTIGTAGSVLMSVEKGNGNEKRSKEIFSTTIIAIVMTAIITTVLLLPIYPRILEMFGAKGEILIEADKYTKTIICGCIFQALGTGIIPILRNKNKAFAAMMCMFAGTGLNVFVNYYLIFVLELGVQGAAMATVFAQFIVTVMGSVILFREEKLFPIFKWKHFARIIKVGIATFGITVSPSIVLMFTNLQCLKYGGHIAAASYAVISYITFPVQSMLSGVGEGVQPLISLCVGANDKDKLIKIRKIALGILFIFACILTMVVVLLSENLGIWFGLSKEALEIFKTGILIYAYVFVLAGFAKFNVSYLNSTLQTSKAIFLTYSESLVVTPIFIFLLPVIFKTEGIWLSFGVTAVVQLVIYQIVSSRK